MTSIRSMTHGVARALLLLAGASAGAAGPATFELTSPTFQAGATLARGQVYNAFGCTGGNVSPALRWSGAPAGTRSFAVTAYDPDAPTGSGWWHWVVYDLPPATTGLEAGAGTADGKRLPAGAKQGRTDFGTAGYGGPCPPSGDKLHRYIFTVYALKTEKLDVGADATAALIGFTIHANSLGSARLTGRYGR